MRLHTEKGASVLAVIIILAILTVTGVVFVSFLTTGVEESTGEVSSVRALYAAEAGVETTIGHLKMNPVSANWLWNDGYKDKPAGTAKFDVEVLEYEARDSTFTGTNKCEPFESVIKSAGANPARTVYGMLSWNSMNNMTLELYDNVIADCNNPTASANLIAPSMGTKPKRIRYRIASSAPATLNYTIRVTGTIGDTYNLRISHPDETNFGTGSTCGQPAGTPFDQCMRGIISLGKASNARREVFTGLSKNP